MAVEVGVFSRAATSAAVRAESLLMTVRADARAAGHQQPSWVTRRKRARVAMTGASARPGAKVSVIAGQELEIP